MNPGNMTTNNRTGGANNADMDDSDLRSVGVDVSSRRQRQGGDSIETIIGLSFGLKNGSRFNFHSETCLNCPFLEHFLSVGNLKPKTQVTVQALKPNFFY